MAINTTRLRPIEWLALAGVLILAAALRLGAPGVVEFKRDEANLSYLSLDMARGRSFPLLGIDSSVGVRNAPASVYLMAIPYLVTSNPVVATQFVGLLNVIAVGLTFALARRYYGPIAATVAGLLYAVSPWAVIFSRKIWAQDMLPLFVLLTVGTGLLGFVEGKRWAQLLHLPLLAITGQIHYGAFVLIPVTLYLLVIGRRRLTRAFLLSVALVIVVVIPYIVGAAQAGLLNLGTLRQIGAPHGKPNDITYTYDNVGNRATMVDPDGGTTTSRLAVSMVSPSSMTMRAWAAGAGISARRSAAHRPWLKNVRSTNP